MFWPCDRMRISMSFQDSRAVVWVKTIKKKNKQISSNSIFIEFLLCLKSLLLFELGCFAFHYCNVIRRVLVVWLVRNLTRSLVRSRTYDQGRFTLIHVHFDRTLDRSSACIKSVVLYEEFTRNETLREHFMRTHFPVINHGTLSWSFLQVLFS